MLKLAVPFLVLMALALSAKADGLLPRELAFYVVRPSPSLPGPDGRLAEQCWGEASVATTYYEYWKPEPGLGKLPTEIRMLYSERGINVRITNFEKEPGKMHAAITSDDDPELWKDDCAQLYFDPAANGVGFVNFTINSLGTRADMKRFDAAVTLPEWSGDEWRAVTKTGKDSWTIEAFFPWSDLGKKASAGDIWKFNHVRFAWGGGKLTGITWAPGGNYANPRHFGYLYFAGPNAVPYGAVANLLSEKAAPPWVVFTDKGVFSCADVAKVDLMTSDQFVGNYRADMEKALRKLEALLGKDQAPPTQWEELKTTVTELAQLKPSEALKEIKRIVEVTQQLDRMYWSERIEQMFGHAGRTEAGRPANSDRPK